jgi:GTP-binding protein Era
VATRSTLIGIAGRPNVGKSTLVNAIVGESVTIVSPRAQTTRRRVAGIAQRGETQLVLVDLPGVQRPRDGLTQRMARSVEETLADVDQVVLVIAASERIGGGDRAAAELAFGTGRPVVIAVNKVDRADPATIAQAIEQVAALGDFAAIHPVSARTGEGVDDLVATLVAAAEAGPWLYPADMRSGDPLRVRLAEIVREQALLRLRDEIPHAVAVVVEEVEEPSRRRAGRVEAVLYVDQPSQQGIVVGAGGTMIKEIGSAARPAIEALLGGRVMLDLRVKTKRGWRDDPALLDRLGP